MAFPGIFIPVDDISFLHVRGGCVNGFFMGVDAARFSEDVRLLASPWGLPFALTSKQVEVMS
jgi:hypothetical protein